MYRTRFSHSLQELSTNFWDTPMIPRFGLCPKTGKRRSDTHDGYASRGEVAIHPFLLPSLYNGSGRVSVEESVLTCCSIRVTSPVLV